MNRFFLILMQPFAKILFAMLRHYQHQNGVLPIWYFFGIARFIPVTAYELLITRQTSEGCEVLLFRRPANDRYWPGLWHYPGTVVRTGDDERDVWQRLSAEVGVPIVVSDIRLLRTKIGNNERGASVFLIHRLESVNGVEFSKGRFFPVNAIPHDTVAECARTIRELHEKRLLTGTK